MSDKIVDFEEYQKSKKESKLKTSTQEEVKAIIENAKPLSKRDIIQLQLIESLAEHVHYLSLLVERLLDEKESLQEQLKSKD
jgi:hypothetical protein